MQQIKVEDANTWRLSGELTFATVGTLLDEFTQCAVPTPPQVVDLGAITHTDSAGLALLIEWVKQTGDTPITFQNVPTQMLNIAIVSGVEEMLSLPDHSELKKQFCSTREQ